MPSTIHSGLLPALSELKPRMRMSGAAPGWPDEFVSCTPATLPASAWATFDCCDLAMSSDLITVADPVKASFLAVPNATTMTSSMDWVSSLRVMSILDARYRDLLRLIADERDEESGIRGSRDRVAAISVRGRTRGRSFDQDGGTCNRISGVVLDRSGYLELLRKGREAGAQHNR